MSAGLFACGALALVFAGRAHVPAGSQAGSTGIPVASAPPVAAPVSGLPDADPSSRLAARYEAPGPKSPLELQRFRRTATMRIRTAGGREGVAELVDVNPRIRDWYVLRVRPGDGDEITLHLENAHPETQSLGLDEAFPGGLVVKTQAGSRPCELWSDRLPDVAREAARGTGPYLELCGGDVLVRHRTQGSRTAREWAADFLRSNVSGGEGLTTLLKRTVYADAFLEQAELAHGAPTGAFPVEEPGSPSPSLVDPKHRKDRLVSRELGVEVPVPDPIVGQWYPAADVPGVYVSLMTAGRVSDDTPGSDRTRALDEVEKNALVYLIAFDLSRLDLGFALGTDHPDVSWSERAPASVRDPALPGPDGFDRLAPLEATGLVPPPVADRVVATFAGGFKRLHGAFKSGELARVNLASHYGFVEGGAILSKLQPGLATLLALDDGRVVMKTWSREDDALLERVRYARQNGVPLLERDEETGRVAPGALVGDWAKGNWGGSQDSKLRAVRAGAGLQESGGRRFLVYGYFSSVTPSAMALVFASYGCSYAMHLDMNALEHTYLAVYRSRAGKLDVEHLVRGMSVLDKTAGGTTVPRFLGYPDNRDFFYLMRKRER